MYPDSVRRLIECLKDLPGIGEKTASRLAFSIIGFSQDRLSEFAESLINVRDKVKRCSVCNNICEGDVCPICSDDKRNIEVLFVVEKPKDVMLFEKMGIFHGKYHVLDGLISPLDGINPGDINIKSLMERVNNDGIKEVILALKPSIEGETTMQYIKRVLSPYHVRVTKMATGVPMGTDMEYIDTMTLEMALEERKDVS